MPLDDTEDCHGLIENSRRGMERGARAARAGQADSQDLFDVPFTLAGHRGSLFAEPEALATLMRIRSSGLVPENVIREADNNRNRRGSANVLVLVQPSGQGNADLGGGPDPQEKASKRATFLAKVGRLSAAVKRLESFLDEMDDPRPRQIASLSSTSWPSYILPEHRRRRAPGR